MREVKMSKTKSKARLKWLRVMMNKKQKKMERKNKLKKKMRLTLKQGFLLARLKNL